VRKGRAFNVIYNQEDMKMSEQMKGKTKKWPYPVHYGKENDVSADILILGGGIAGCHAAISAAKRGVKVAVVDKGAVIASGFGGAGVDHWHGACTNPCSKITPDEMMEAASKAFSDYFYHEYGNGITCYILFKESWDALQDVEKMGLAVRDVEDEFVGAEFRDEKTKLMFAYDYENKNCVRVNGGAGMKPALYKELKRLGVAIFDRVMATSLLTEGGRQGARVVGATGVNTRTGEFYIFKAKATVLSTAVPFGLWMNSTELAGVAAMTEPNNTGDGTAMAWQAGAELTMMERSIGPYPLSGFNYPAYGTGNPDNTWYACTIVDANGKEIPYVDRDGNILKTVSERYRPAPGQKFFFPYLCFDYEFMPPSLIPDLPDRIMNGEFKLPLYADLPSMPEHERRALWGLMVGNEGKTRIPIYDTYTKAGFDPDKDMLQANVMPPDQYFQAPWWGSIGPRQWRELGFCAGGGLVFDWDLKTSLEGLYVAGMTTYAGGDHATAATTGRYAGRKAAEYAREAGKSLIERKQVEEEKARVYAPVQRKDGTGWKELRAGLCRIMQDYCGEYKNEEVLKIGLGWLESIRESEASRAYAKNPHELVRTLECLSRVTVGELIMHASLARKASNVVLGLNRLDYPEVDPPEWDKLVTIKQKDGDIEVGEMPLKYWLLPPNAPTYEENYKKHCSLEGEVK
jgi:succinate dehydrogenase/fumarate reductase flavoprotein subunit